MEYRVSICGEDKLPEVEFRVLDANKNVLYSNKDANYAKTWDFKLQSSQQLKIVVKVNTFNKPGDTPASGCVAIMFDSKSKNNILQTIIACKYNIVETGLRPVYTCF